jgi:protease I
MRLEGTRIAYLVEDGFEDLELWVPVMRLREEGAEVRLVGTGRRREHRGKHGLPAQADSSVEEVRAEDFDAVVIPGGWAPDKLRRSEGVKRLVRDAYQQGKVIGAICHAGWVPISAGIVRGHRATGSEAIRDDLENAGATWVDAPAFRDDPFVWGRVVDDIPAFCRELVEAIAVRRTVGAAR